MTLKIERSWFEALEGEIQKPYILKLKEFLLGERREGYTIFPPTHLIFKAFLLTPFEQVKVVIVGQDPYHGVGQAHGLCFSVQRGVGMPPSLKNIYKELERDLGIVPARHGCLEKWARQGVLMLNATLTVRAGQPQSHCGRGWERFTDAVIEKLCVARGGGRPLVFILWGSFARKKLENIVGLCRGCYAVLKAAHPSPYSAKGFFGCCHFSKTNEFLQKWGEKPIDWSLDG